MREQTPAAAAEMSTDKSKDGGVEMRKTMGCKQGIDNPKS